MPARLRVAEEPQTHCSDASGDTIPTPGALRCEETRCETRRTVREERARPRPELGPTVKPDVNARFVDDEDLITSAGSAPASTWHYTLCPAQRAPSAPAKFGRGIQYHPQPPL